MIMPRSAAYQGKKLRLALLVAILAPAGVAPAASGDAEVRGPAIALDGQTLEIAGKRLALKGVLAPPLGMSCQTKRDKPYACGQLAQTALSDIVRNQVIVCRPETGHDEKTMGEPLAECHVGPFDVNEQMILGGRAVAAEGADDRLRRAERAARLLGEGLWKGRFPPPTEWRP